MRSKRLLSLLAILTLLISLTIALPITSADGGGDSESLPSVPQKQPLQYPNLGSHLSGLAEGYEAGQMSQQQAASETPASGSIAVTIHLDANVDAVEQFLENNRGDPRNVGEDYIEAYVPVRLLGRLSQQPGVIRVREIIPPQPARGSVTSQGVAAHLADVWHNHEDGITGEGVKVGVIDTGFYGLQDLLGTELPTAVVGLCYTDFGVSSGNLSACDNDEQSKHGTAVAETIMDIAPDATLYIANPVSRADLLHATEWMAAQGVQVINHSVSWTFDGPGDGTSPNSFSPLNTVDWAVDNGIIWVSSAGNNAQDTWYGPYLNPDGNGWVDFNRSGMERHYLRLPELDITAHFSVELRWEDTWGDATSDLDLFVYKDPSRIMKASKDVQFGRSGDNPHEYLRIEVDLSSAFDDGYFVSVSHELGEAPEWIQLRITFLGSLVNPTKSGSIGNPAESANPGMLAVGAAHYWETDTEIASYSSQGPTPDRRAEVKPDIVGTACAESVSYEHHLRDGQDCWFAGTSQAAPHVAGLAALVRQKLPDATPQQVASYLKNSAADRGAAGPDNVWGHGFAQLPAPGEAPPVTVADCVTPITADDTYNGQWAAGCDSEERQGRHARYYPFTLAQDSNVTIALESSDADTYLNLWAGSQRTGTPHAYNDDSPDTSRSAISGDLPAGDYTIEATTYEAGETGGFTLTVSGLGGGGTAPPPVTGSDPCVTELTADAALPGTWAAGCDSEVSDRGHAQYYTFTLAQPSEVTIVLESNDADTYLYLRAGDDVRSGAFIHENDDSPDTSRSAISGDLPAGDYTIEATTYEAGETGGFTLTVSGIGAAAPAPAACSEGDILSPGDSCNHDDFTITVESNGDLSLRFTGSAAPPQGLDITRSGNDWTINSLPN